MRKLNFKQRALEIIGDKTDFGLSSVGPFLTIKYFNPKTKKFEFLFVRLTQEEYEELKNLPGEEEGVF